MKRSDFTIGKFFWMSGRKYLCTDIGTRVIVAVRYNPGELARVGLSSHQGKHHVIKNVLERVDKKDFKLPYRGLGELIIVSYDYEACFKTCTPFQKKLAAVCRKRDREANQRWLRERPLRLA